MPTAGRAPSFFETVNLYFEQAAALTDYPRGLLEQIKVCNGVYAFQFPVRTRRGYEVEHASTVAAALSSRGGAPSTAIIGSPSRAASGSRRR